MEEGKGKRGVMMIMINVATKFVRWGWDWGFISVDSFKGWKRTVASKTHMPDDLSIYTAKAI